MEKDFPIFRNYLEEEDDKPYFTVNSLAYYYEDMERKQKLITDMSKLLLGYDTKLNVNLEEMEKRIAAELGKWDSKVEELPETVNDLLTQWVEDGSLTALMDTTLLDKKADITLLDKKADVSQVNTLTAQLAETAIDGTRRTNDIQFSNIKKKPLVTFVDDDLSYNLIMSKLKPIFESNGVPLVLGVPSSFIQPTHVAGLKDVRDRLGWEIASHGKYHIPLDTATDAQLDDEIRGSFEQLRSWGLPVENMVYMGGIADARARKKTAEYYKSGVAANNIHLNDVPLKQFFMPRTGLGSYFNPVPNGDTLEYYKSRIDQAIAENKWLIFMVHIAGTNETQLDFIRQTVEYAVAKKIDVVTLKDGLKIYGNVSMQGDLWTDVANDNYSVVTKTGERFENFYKKNEVNSGTLIKNFPVGVSTKTFSNLDTNGFPLSNGGLLTTHREKEGNDYSFQLWRPYDSYSLFHRYVKADGSWSTFRNQTDSLNPSTNITGSSVPSDFQPNSSSKIMIVNGTGFPAAYGLLKTDSYIRDLQYCKQTFSRFNDRAEYTRYWITATNTWSPWLSETYGLPKSNATIDFGTINAQSTKTVIVPYTGAAYGDMVMAQPVSPLPSGLSIYSNEYSTDNVQISLVNSTSGVVTVGSKSFVVKVIRL